MRRVVVLLVTVLWIVFVWLSVAGEARALFQARNLQASSNAGAASRWKPTHFHDAQIERANTERSESAEHSENTHAEQDAQAIAALAASIRQLGAAPGIPREIAQQAQQIEVLADGLRRAD